MSVISRALKMAQREKDQRSGQVPPATPVIIRRRGAGPDESSFSWKNTLTIAGSIVVIVVASASLWTRMRPKQAAPRGVPVPAATIAAAENPPAKPTSAPVEAPPVIATPVTRAAATDTATSAAPRPRRPRGVTAPAATALAQADSAAKPAPLREPVQSGRLRIAVEQSLEGDAARLFAVGVAAHRAGDLAAARSAYERVLALQPNDVDALNNMGILLAATREYDQADALLRRAVRLAPRNAGAWNNLGTVLAQRAQHTDAVAAFQQALALDPQHQGARVSLAQQFLAIGAGDRARQALEEVIAMNPSMPEAYYALGQALELEQRWPDAIRAYESFVRVAPARMSADIGRVQQRIQLLAGRTR